MYGLPDSAAGYYAKRYARSVKSLRSGSSSRAGWTLGFSTTSVILYSPQIKRILNTPSGKLWKALDRRGDAIVRDARKQAGIQTGALRKSIHKRHLANATGQYLWIGSKKNYAYIHHEGSRPHIITPNKSPVLTFRSGARIVRTTIVSHPGTRPNRYLTQPMRTNLIRPIVIR
jgi:hypothetical protein